MAESLEHIAHSIAGRRLLKRGEKILVAVSGGLDSMVLLHALHELSREHRWKLAVAHFNHQLRGRSSDADEKLVRRTAARLKLPFFPGRAEVRKFSRQSGLSLEMAARKLRHEFFARTAGKHGFRTIALAHHADDQVELFFLRLLRGAGGEGLAGMKWRAPSPVDKNLTLIRPFLDLSKADLKKFAAKNKITFREDATNATLDVPRNRVRNELLPSLRKNFSSALNPAILRVMDIVGAESGLVAELAERWLAKRKPKFAVLPIAVQRRILQAQLHRQGIAADFDLIEQLRFFAGQPVAIRPEVSVRREATGDVTLVAVKPVGFNIAEKKVKLGKTGETIFGDVAFKWKIAPGKTKLPRHQKNREFFDADKIGGQITLRHWRAGDRFQPIGMKSAAKLQDLFTNAKIPRPLRHLCIVAVAATGGIFWVENLRIGERFKLTPQTQNRLAWAWRR